MCLDGAPYMSDQGKSKFRKWHFVEYFGMMEMDIALPFSTIIVVPPLNLFPSLWPGEVKGTATSYK